MCIHTYTRGMWTRGEKGGSSLVVEDARVPWKSAIDARIYYIYTHTHIYIRSFVSHRVLLETSSSERTNEITKRRNEWAFHLRAWLSNGTIEQGGVDRGSWLDVRSSSFKLATASRCFVLFHRREFSGRLLSNQYTADFLFVCAKFRDTGLRRMRVKSIEKKCIKYIIYKSITYYTIVYYIYVNICLKYYYWYLLH